jgi:hypothetical protein
MSTLILLVLIAIVLYIVFVPPSKIQEPSAEYFTTTPDPDYPATTTVVTPDELDQVIRLTQKALSAQIKECTYCIETTQISLTGNTYTGAFLFMVVTGFPYGVSVISTVVKGESGDPETVTSVQLQNMNTIDQMDAFDQFKSGADIETSTLPQLADLQSTLNSV